LVFTESLCWRSCISFSFSDNFASIFLLVKGHKSLFLTSLGYHMRYTGILHVYYKAHLSHDVLRRLHNAYIDSFSSRLTYENNKNIGNNCIISAVGAVASLTVASVPQQVHADPNSNPVQGCQHFYHFYLGQVQTGQICGGTGGH